MNDQAMDDLQAKIREIMDATGLDEVTAAKIASPHVGAPRDQAPPSITSATVKSAMNAPPTANEPLLPALAYTTHCPDCAGAGFYKLAVPYGHPDFGVLQPCRCKLAERTRYMATRHTQILNQLQGELGAHADKCFSTFDPTHHDPDIARTLAATLAAAEAYAAACQGWLYLWGECDCGKSHLAAAIANAAAARAMRVSYASVPGLLRFLKAGFRDNSADRRMLALQVADLLVLDDLGTEYHRRDEDGYDYNDSALFELLNERATYRRATVITSNVPPDEHEPRIAARIRRSGRVIWIDADAYATRRRT